jgi:hypothetical protein
LTKNDFLDYPQFIEEAQKITQIAMNPSRSTTGPSTWTNPRTNTTYSVTSGGELALAKKIRDDNISVFGVIDIVTDLNKKAYGSKGTTANRPTLTASDDGYSYFDTTLKQPIWWDGSAWIEPTNGRTMVQLINRTGSSSVKGTLVSAASGYDNAFVLQSNEFDTIGVVLTSGITDGELCWIITNGVAEVLLKDGTAATRGNWVIAADTDGRADASQPTPTPNTTLGEHTTHFKEVGHCLETKNSGTNVLAKVIFHPL